MSKAIWGAAAAVALCAPGAAEAQAGEIERLRAELSAANARIDAQERRLQSLEAALAERGPPTLADAPAGGTTPSVNAAQGSASISPGDPSTIQAAPVETVGVAPEDDGELPGLAVLGDQGGVITKAGQLTGELGFEYARADRNRALFRGIEIVESVLVGVFDVNESRQDVLTAAASLRYGITDRLEVGARIPYVYRSDRSVLAPIAGSTTNDPAATRDSSATGNGIGDIELSARYQLTTARPGQPFLIANLQAVVPTGTNPFNLPRDTLGRALEAATGAGFYGISPSITAILPSDPAVLFGTVGYTFNLGDDVDTLIPPVRVTFVDPGDSIALSAGVGLAVNERTSLNLGYAHSWAFGTKTRTETLMPGPMWSEEREAVARDLQLGRFLFGVTYRISDVTSLNWSVEVGATDDATDLRTVIRIPTVLFGG